jgi:hypothetical protein
MTQPSYEAASNATVPPVPPDIPAGSDGDLVPVFVLNAVRTSAGSGHGVKLVLPAEAARLVAAKLAVHGDQPPRGWNLPV